MAPIKPQESLQTLTKGMFRRTHEEQRAAVPPFYRNYWEKLAKRNGYYNIEFMRKWGDGLEQEWVLDAGCGQSSTLTTHEPPLQKIVGLDPLREDMLIYEGARAKVQGVLEKLPFADGVFGGVYSDSVFEHIFDPGQVTREFFRITKPGGRVIINTNSVFNPFMFPNKFMTIRQREWVKKKLHIESEGTYPAPYRINTKWQLTKYLRDAGFTDIRIYRWGVPAVYRPRWFLAIQLTCELIAELPVFCVYKHRLMATGRKP